jgi:hypothetical protein
MPISRQKLGWLVVTPQSPHSMLVSFFSDNRTTFQPPCLFPAGSHRIGSSLSSLVFPTIKNFLELGACTVQFNYSLSYILPVSKFERSKYKGSVFASLSWHAHGLSRFFTLIIWLHLTKRSAIGSMFYFHVHFVLTKIKQRSCLHFVNNYRGLGLRNNCILDEAVRFFYQIWLIDFISFTSTDH